MNKWNKLSLFGNPLQGAKKHPVPHYYSDMNLILPVDITNSESDTIKKKKLPYISNRTYRN